MKKIEAVIKPFADMVIVIEDFEMDFIECVT
jgi:hypothetical protein